MTALPLALPEAAGKIAKAVNNDIIVVHGQRFRKIVVQEKRKRTKRHPAQEEIAVLSPVEWEVHVNPVSIGLGAAALAAAGLIAWVVWNGVTVGVPTIGEVSLIPGFKDRESETPPEGESLACMLCRALGPVLGVIPCAACAAGA